MNTEQQLEIVQAKSDGKPIEFRRLGRTGANGDGGTWHRGDFTRFNFVDYEYRIGEVLKYVILDRDGDQWGKIFNSTKDAQLHLERFDVIRSYSPFKIYRLTEV